MLGEYRKLQSLLSTETDLSIATRKRYNIKNKEKKLIYGQLWYMNNKERRRLYAREHRKSNKTYYVKFRADNAESLKNKSMSYWLKNKEAALFKSSLNRFLKKVLNEI